MYKISVMGDYDSIYGFAALGLTTFPVRPGEEAEKTLNQIVESGYGIIYITEELAATLRGQIARYADRVTPAIILIPGVKGNTGAGVQGVKNSVEQAVGNDILFGGEE